MRRFETGTEKYMLAVGVDHITSSYVQVWKQPHDEQNMAILVIDNTGVHQREPIPELERYLVEIRERFEYSRQQGNFSPNLDEATICEIARRLGFDSKINQTIYEVLD